MYDKRKQYLIKILEKEMVLLSNKAKYIMEVLEGTIDLRKKKKDEITSLLKSKNYDVIDDDEDYKYLIKMPMDSVSEENVSRLINDHENKSKELKLMKELTIHKMWSNELDELSEQYTKYKDNRQKSYTQTTKIKLGKRKLK